MTRQDYQQESRDARRRLDVDRLIDEQRLASFEPAHQAQVDDSEVLGILVAHWAEWDGERICTAFLSALQDANYHTLREFLEPIIRAELAR